MAVVPRWRPERGQVVLLELLDERDAPVLTGAVESGGGPGPVTVHLGASPPLPAERCEVIASFFTTGALYLARGTARQLAERWLVELDVRELQTVQRRGAPRVPRRYPVAVGAFSGLDDYVSVAGETVDLAPGGCRVLVDQPLPEATEATVCIRLSEDSVMAHARVLENRADGGRWEYRLAFDQIEAPDRRRLATLLRER
jgi:hypothetical protein